MPTAQSTSGESGSTEQALSIDVPGALGGGTARFTPSHFRFKDKEISYSEIETMSFHALKQSVNLIPVSQTYKFMVASRNSKISFSIGTTLHIGRKAKEQAWAEVVAASMRIVAPRIVAKLASAIFDRHQDVTIGPITFDQRGNSKDRLLREKKKVSWLHRIYIPTMQAGRVILMEDKGGKPRRFASVSTAVPNAVVIPGLVQECYNRTH